MLTQRLRRRSAAPRRRLPALPLAALLLAALLLAALLLVALLLVAGPPAAGAQPASGRLGLELNRLEPRPELSPPGCRAWLVLRNAAEAALDTLRLDLVLFDRAGVIARRLALDVGPLPAAKTTVRIFDLAGQPCETIGAVLLNDLLACGTPDTRADCLTRLDTASRVARRGRAPRPLTPPGPKAPGSPPSPGHRPR